MQEKISEKLRRIHASLKAVDDGDFSRARWSKSVAGTTGTVGIDIGPDLSQDELINRVMGLAANIASLKDHLKEWCNETRVDFPGDQLINSNLNVAIIHDLWNTAKHAKLKSGRSGLAPVLGKLQLITAVGQRTTPGKGGELRFTMHGFRDGADGKMDVTGSGPVSRRISGPVLNSAGDRIGDIFDLCKSALGEWERLLEDAGFSLGDSDGIDNQPKDTPDDGEQDD